MTDIVQRLRIQPSINVNAEAADEIERLRQQREMQSMTELRLASTNAQLRKQNDELLAIIEKIASLHYSNTSAASIAQSALDTMRVLKE